MPPSHADDFAARRQRDEITVEGDTGDGPEAPASEFADARAATGREPRAS